MILGTANVGSRKTGVMPDGLPVVTKSFLLLSTPIQRLREGEMQLGTLGGEAKGLAVCLDGLPRILFRLFGKALLMVEDRHPEEGPGMTRVHLQGRLEVCHRTKWQLLLLP